MARTARLHSIAARAELVLGERCQRTLHLRWGPAVSDSRITGRASMHNGVGGVLSIVLARASRRY
eukprot:8572241-Prorocentrum_lima.AAC.1